MARTNFDSASLIKDAMSLMEEYLYSLCPTATFGEPKLESSGKLSLLTRLNSFVNGNSAENMSSAFWGIISDSILIKLRNSTSTTSSSSMLSPTNSEESRMVNVVKLFCELNVRARTSFGGSVNPVRFPPSAFFLSECLQSAFVYIRNVNNLSGKLLKYSEESLESNIDSSCPDKEAGSSKRSAVSSMEEEQRKQMKLTENTSQSATTSTSTSNSITVAGAPSPPAITDDNLSKIEQIIRSFCQSKHIRAIKTGEAITKAPLLQQEQQDIFNILQHPFRQQQSLQQQHTVRSSIDFLSSSQPADKPSPDKSSMPPERQPRARKEFTRRHKKHPNRYVLTVQNPRFRPISCKKSSESPETIVSLTFGHIPQVRKVSDSPLLPLSSEFDDDPDGMKATFVFLSISLITAMKGLEVLPNNRYRVQLNTFLVNKKKLSRNTPNLYEALWIFEISLLISDQPKTLDRMLRDGNYSTLSALSCLGFIRSPTEYYFELLRMLLLFYERGVYFKNELIEAAITNFDQMKPSELTEDCAGKSISKGSFELHCGLLQNGAEKEQVNFRPIYGFRRSSLAAILRSEKAGDGTLPIMSASTLVSVPAAAETIADDDSRSEEEDNDSLSVSSSDPIDKAMYAAAKTSVNVDLEPVNLSSSDALASHSFSSAPGQQASADESEHLADAPPHAPPVYRKVLSEGHCAALSESNHPPSPKVDELLPTDTGESNPVISNLKQWAAGYRNGLSLKDQGLSCRNFRSSSFQALQIADSAPFIITLSANTAECFEQKMRPVISMMKHVAI